MPHSTPAPLAAADTDCLLLQWTSPEGGCNPEIIAQAARTAGSPALATALQQHLPGATLELQRFAWSAATGQAYVYLALSQRCTVSAAQRQAAAHAAGALLPGMLRASRLELVFARPGASAGAACTAHYVVEMDPDAGWMPEIARWYDQEHMPGLAAVTGCIDARRYLNHDSGPLSLACYDLVMPETLGCPAWLQVRATAWSDITRPHFTNTLRTMFAAVDAAPH